MYEIGKTPDNHFCLFWRLSASFCGSSGFYACGKRNCRIQFWWFSMVSILNQRPVRWHLVILAFATAAVCLQAHAQTDKDKAPSKPKYGVNKPLGETYAAVNSVAGEQTRLVLYRAPLDTRKATDKPADQVGVVSVYLNDRYHASLQKEAFSVVCLVGKKAEVRTRFLPDVTADINPELDTRHTVAMKGGQSVYLRVAEMAGQKSRIDVVTPQTAAAELANAKQQMHTLSRVPGVQPCREAEDTRIVFDPNVITFGSDAIFDLKKTEIHAISVEGRQELKNIIQKINVKYKTFADVKVHVVGFADDESDETLNRRISQDRAKTVRAFFKAQGLRTTALTFEGRGSDDKQKAQLFGLSPRRVEVEVAVDIH
jgi:OmpA-OmpF porin, OOP family